MINSLSIIPAMLSDVKTLLLLMKKFYSIDGYDFNSTQTETSLNEFISAQQYGRIWMIRTDETIIGYIILAIVYSFEFGGRNAFIDELYLEHEFRGKGIGKRVMEFITEEAKKMNIKGLHLEVERHNEKALSLYRAFQFKDHHRILMTRMINE